jgi:hypothetical protein
MRKAFNTHLLANDISLSPKAAFPERIGQQDHMACARFSIGLVNQPPQHRPHTQRPKKIRCHHCCRNSYRLSRAYYNILWLSQAKFRNRRHCLFPVLRMARIQW